VRDNKRESNQKKRGEVVAMRILYERPYKSNAKKPSTPDIILSGRQLSFYLDGSFRRAFSQDFLACRKKAEFLV